MDDGKALREAVDRVVAQVLVTDRLQDQGRQLVATGRLIDAKVSHRPTVPAVGGAWALVKGCSTLRPTRQASYADSGKGALDTFDRPWHDGCSR